MKKENIYEARVKTFWDEIKGIMALLNNSNPTFKITDHRDPTITQYLLWRILTEGKLNNQSNKLKEKIVMFRTQEEGI